MLSRSKSSAGDRLRRAKSTSSTHTSSSGHYRTSTQIDPFVTRQYAETAAVEAYNRAQQLEEPTLEAYRPVPPKIQLRRSQVTGKTEGSHFEGARLSRRRSNSTRGEAERTRPSERPAPRFQRSETEANNQADEEERIITRKRSVIQPNNNLKSSRYDQVSLPSSTTRLRTTQSSYTDGSPAPRHASALLERSSTLQFTIPRKAPVDAYGGNLAHLSDFGELTDMTTRSVTSQRPSIRETQTDEEILAIARDRCLQDFQQRKVRDRKSMFLAPFQQRRAVTAQRSSDTGFDHSLPPFNYADDANMAPLPPTTEPAVAPIPVMNLKKKSRNFSDSMKGRLKKIFRKEARAPDGIPTQHVDAKHLHYVTSTEPFHSCSEQNADPFLTVTRVTPVPPSEHKSSSGTSRLSAGKNSTAKSRVTSWANSTVDGTWSSRPDTDHLAPADEYGGLKRSDSRKTLRKASSFFGKPIRNKLRRPSKPELHDSRESQGLYSALQERMNSGVQTQTTELSNDSEPVRQPRITSALSTLPSQQRTQIACSDVSQSHESTIRSVTPNPLAYRLGVPSPVAEVLSPGVEMTAVHGHHQSETEPTRTSYLRRRPAVKAAPPSQEQITRRVERSINRWKSPLDELSPKAPESTRTTMVEDNPYELRSFSQSLCQLPPSNDLPRHAKVGQQPSVDRQNMLSPSIYSRRTDGASPRADTPVEETGVRITITGREVRTYDISPKKPEPDRERPVHASHEWRQWLSDETNGFKAVDTDLTLRKGLLTFADIAVQNRSRSVSAHDSRPVSMSPALDIRPHSSATQLVRASSRRSSFMNERYPMIESKRNSSDRSIGSRQAPSRTGERSSGSEQSAGNEEYSSAASQPQKCSLKRQRVISGRKSSAQLENGAGSRSALGTYGNAQYEWTSVDATNAGGRVSAPSDKATLPLNNKSRVAGRPKSALDLKVNYNNNHNPEAKPLEVRRKPLTEARNILEDTTIQGISAGPYAAQHSNEGNKENTPPPEANSLPALSSSEWLAAGNHKACKPSGVYPANRNRSGSRYSPSKTSYQKDEKGSPAQRMATEFLEKRSRENTPAFV